MVGRGEPLLRHDAFEAHLAGMQEHHGAVLVGVLVDGDPNLHAGQQPRQAILALAERQRTVVDPIELQQVEGTRDSTGRFARSQCGRQPGERQDRCQTARTGGTLYGSLPSGDRDSEVAVIFSDRSD
jgi:hypothetical protein